jgi:sugar lactone lactonase YvrE
MDIDQHQIHQHTIRADNDATHRVWQLPLDARYDIGAMALADNGDLMLALRAGIASFNPDEAPKNISPEILIPAPYDMATSRFNDGGVDAQGRWWIGSLYAPKTHAGAHLFCLECGVLKPILGELANIEPYTNWGITTANGWAISPDGTTMYHADTQAHTVYRYDFDASAPVETALSNRTVFFQTLDTRGTDAPYQGRPDGAAVDSEGNYWLALYEGAAIVKIAPNGNVVQKIPLPAKAPTMLCFGGADLKTLIITTAGNRPESELAHYPTNGHILTLKSDTAGLAPQRYRSS